MQHFATIATYGARYRRHRRFSVLHLKPRPHLTWYRVTAIGSRLKMSRQRRPNKQQSIVKMNELNATVCIRYSGLLVRVVIILSVISYSGLHIAGNLSIVISIISMSPFVIMVFLSIPKIDPSRWTVMPIKTS